MKTYLFKILSVGIVLLLTCVLFDAALAENIGLKSGDNMRAIQQLPRPNRISSGEKVAVPVVSNKVSVGKMEIKPAAVRTTVRVQSKVGNMGEQVSFQETSSVSESRIERLQLERAVKPSVEMASMESVAGPKIEAQSAIPKARTVAVNTIKPNKIVFEK